VIREPAIAREKEIKGWRRDKKNDLIEKMNSEGADITDALTYETSIAYFSSLSTTAMIEG